MGGEMSNQSASGKLIWKEHNRTNELMSWEKAAKQGTKLNVKCVRQSLEKAMKDDQVKL